MLVCRKPKRETAVDDRSESGVYQKDEHKVSSSDRGYAAARTEAFKGIFQFYQNLYWMLSATSITSFSSFTPVGKSPGIAVVVSDW